MFHKGLSAVLATVMLGAAALATADEVVVYSARNEELIKPLFDAYTARTGVTVRYVTDKEGPLLEKLKAEGPATPADLLITVDAGNLWQAATVEGGVLQPIRSETLDKNIPAHLRDPDGHWYGLSIRARTMVYAPERVKEGELTTYEDLAAPRWRGRLCLRSSKKVYNQSLVAMMIARHGEEKTEKIVAGWVANLAQPPFANDNEVMEAIAAGVCDVGLVNTYYFGRLKKEKPEIDLKLFWPNQKESGVHVNISGAGVTRHAKHKEAATALLEWFSTPEAQRLFADLNREYPANPAVPANAEVAAWGAFKQDDQNLSQAGRLQTRAVQLMDRVGYK